MLRNLSLEQKKKLSFSICRNACSCELSGKPDMSVRHLGIGYAVVKKAAENL